MVQVLESRFLSSASSIDNAPSPSTTEIVCLGRSNVGKSTFINALLNKPLAKSSATPGKTQLINFFYSLWAMRNEHIPLTLIDLPGFGYAKVSKSLKNEWQKHLLRSSVLRLLRATPLQLANFCLSRLLSFIFVVLAMTSKIFCMMV